jgi:hypothetical protein
MCAKVVSVVAWQAKSHGYVADKTAQLLHYQLKIISFPCVMQQCAGTTLSKAPVI